MEQILSDLEKLKVHTIPYTNLYTVQEINNNKVISEFIQKFKGSNFLRVDKKELDLELNDNNLSYLSSAKHDQNYVLYRGLKTKVGDVYTDHFPSSWSFNIEIAKKFSYKANVICGIFPAESILVDIAYVLGSDYESEVIVLPGTYPITHISTNRSVNKIKPEIFTDENYDNLISNKKIGNPHYFTIDEYLNYCLESSINIKKGKKSDIVEQIINYYKNL